jgi:hypothetical protein
MEVMQQFVEMKRLSPLENVEVEVGNRRFESEMLRIDELMFGWVCGEERVPEGRRFWYF